MEPDGVPMTLSLKKKNLIYNYDCIYYFHFYQGGELKVVYIVLSFI